MVKEDAIKHNNIKGTKTGAVGRPSMMPEQLGHYVKIHGDYEYCLGCGRCTKAKHMETAKHVFWRRDICTPVLSLRQYHNTQHKIGFDGWWCCAACEDR
eukprot:12205504-Heterocapsa_arctica.AAC.1